ncbi:hypothetical protein K474DRAFT_1695059 [Panus rudis PR-1116 ss-1]|nr:hypothetical protein K474DRAFT_1695059 [Panus rudis PR-1116 ss-1]
MATDPSPSTSFAIDEDKLSTLSGSSARQWLLDQASAAEDFILTLRQRANTFAEIHRLPDDLLAEIFALRVSEKPSAVWALSAVCHRWRQVVLDCQLFWSQVDLNSLERAEVYLKRSGTAPLALDLDRESDDDDEDNRINGFLLNQLLTGHSTRATSLNIYLPFASMCNVLEDLHCPFPAMENLRLRCVTFKSEPRDSISTVPYNPPTPLSSSIKVLWLQKVIVPWTSPAFDNLVDLDLRDQVRNASVAPSMEEFLAVLARSPNLENLSLSFAGPMLPDNPASYPDPNPDNRISLPQLKRISLHNRSVDIAHLLANLIFPNTTRVKIFVVLTAGAEALMELLPRGGKLSTLERVETLRLKYTENFDEVPWDDTSIMIEGLPSMSSIPPPKSTDASAAEEEESPALLSIHFKLHEGNAEHAWRVELPSLFRALPALFPSPHCTSLIKTLDFHWNYYHFTSEDWRVVLTHFNELENMDIYSNWSYYADEKNVEDLLDVLTPPLIGASASTQAPSGNSNAPSETSTTTIQTAPPGRPTNGNTNASLLLPSLRRLKLAEFSMGDNFVSALMDCLSARHSRNVPLDGFSLGNFYWRGEKEFVLPDWSTCLTRKKEEEKVDITVEESTETKDAETKDGEVTDGELVEVTVEDGEEEGTAVNDSETRESNAEEAEVKKDGAEENEAKENEANEGDAGGAETEEDEAGENEAEEPEVEQAKAENEVEGPEESVHEARVNVEDEGPERLDDASQDSVDSFQEPAEDTETI